MGQEKLCRFLRGFYAHVFDACGICGCLKPESIPNGIATHEKGSFFGCIERSFVEDDVGVVMAFLIWDELNCLIDEGVSDEGLHEGCRWLGGDGWGEWFDDERC